MRLLLVEDEIKLTEALSEILKLESYIVDVVTNGIAGLDSALNGIYDVIILDVMLPGKSGFEILKEIRRGGLNTPVLMLTAKSELDDKVQGLDIGADDYLTKPFMTKELLARLRAICRRKGEIADNVLHFGDILLDPKTCQITCARTELSVKLSLKEYQLLESLIYNQGQILKREQLALKIWGYDSEAEYNNVEVYVSFTRKKISFIGSTVKIKAIRGIGYELQASHV